jgi:hypothetical protein
MSYYWSNAKQPLLDVEVQIFSFTESKEDRNDARYDANPLGIRLYISHRRKGFDWT